MKPASPRGKHRDRDSIATNAPVVGRRYSRRSVAFDRLSLTAASDQPPRNGRGNWPVAVDEGRLGARRRTCASSDTTKLTAIGTGTSAGRPVTRSTSVSAITWPRERPSAQVSAAAAQRRIHRHALCDRKQCRQPRHGVRRRPDRDRALGLGVRRPVHDGLRVQPVGDLPAAAATRASPIPSRADGLRTVPRPASADPQRLGTPIRAPRGWRATPTAPRTRVRPACAASRTPTPWRSRGVCRHVTVNHAAPAPPRSQRHDLVSAQAPRRRTRRHGATRRARPRRGPDPPRRHTSPAPKPRCGR